MTPRFRARKTQKSHNKKDPLGLLCDSVCLCRRFGFWVDKEIPRPVGQVGVITKRT